MRCSVGIFNAISEKHFRYSRFVKRIIAIEAQLYFWAWLDYSNYTFPLFSVTREGESLCETKEQLDKLDKPRVAWVMKNKNLAAL